VLLEEIDVGLGVGVIGEELLVGRLERRRRLNIWREWSRQRQIV
jgi:hypothetical protein